MDEFLQMTSTKADQALPMEDVIWVWADSLKGKALECVRVYRPVGPNRRISCTFQNNTGTFGIFSESRKVNIVQCMQLCRLSLQETMPLFLYLCFFLFSLCSLWWLLRIVFLFVCFLIFLRTLKRMKSLPTSNPVAVQQPVTVGLASSSGMQNLQEKI